MFIHYNLIRPKRQPLYNVVDILCTVYRIFIYEVNKNRNIFCINKFYCSIITQVCSATWDHPDICLIYCCMKTLPWINLQYLKEHVQWWKYYLSMIIVSWDFKFIATLFNGTMYLSFIILVQHKKTNSPRLINIPFSTFNPKIFALEMYIHIELIILN